jgi:urease accessory protein UreF
MTDPRLLSLLHFADSAFPTGGYAHSFGLRRIVRPASCEAGGPERFLVAQIEGSAGPCDATAAVSALRAAVREDLQACREVDATLEAMKPVKEFRRGAGRWDARRSAWRRR